MSINFNDYLIPLVGGQAVSKGWTSVTNYKPSGIVWHWTASSSLTSARATIGGANAQRKGEASAHFTVGRSLTDGIDRYVDITNRSWHCGVNQTLRWDGQPSISSTSATRTMIGIETVNIGYERSGIPAKPGWIKCSAPNGQQEMLVEPWTQSQIQMMISLGKHIVAAYPNIKHENHVGHHDLCPGYKVDVCGFPFADVLRGIYDDPTIPDIWSPYLLVSARQKALVDMGYNIGSSGVDGDWGRMCDAALRKFQRENGLVENGMWTIFVSRKVWHKLHKS